MAIEGQEPVSSMGNDTPLAVMSDKPQRLVQLFQAAFCTGYQSAHRSHP